MNRKKVTSKYVPTGRPRGRPPGSKTIKRPISKMSGVKSIKGVSGGCNGDKRCQKCNKKLRGGIEETEEARGFNRTHCKRCKYDLKECGDPKYECDTKLLADFLRTREGKEARELALYGNLNPYEDIPETMPPRLATAQRTLLERREKKNLLNFPQKLHINQ